MLKRLFRAALAAVISVELVLAPVVTHAQALRADSVGGHTPTLDSAQNGVPVVNTAAPNGAGVSHNQFTDFNVGPQGLILNNSTADGVSRLGGVLTANPNLAGRSGATLILNEVTGGTRSHLEGFTEVFGRSADVIVANPNGITCAGCGFLNTPRATLTTGTPSFAADGAVQSLSVTQGAITVTGAGLNGTGVDALDLISRSVTLDGAVTGDQVTVVAGANTVDYTTRSATAQPADAASTPRFAIDSSALGGMYANRIALVATEQGVGVNMQGDMASTAGDLRITSDGRLDLRKASASGAVALTSSADGVALGGSVAAGTSLTVTAATTASARGQTLTSEEGLALSAATVDVDGARVVSAKGGITAQGGTALSADGASLGAATDITLSAPDLTLSGATVAAGQGGSGSLTLHGTNAGSLTADRATLSATTALTAEGGTLSLSDATLTAPRLALSASSRLTGDTTRLDAADSLTLSGPDLSLLGARLIVGAGADGTLGTLGVLTLSTTGSLDLGDSGTASVGGRAALTVGTLAMDQHGWSLITTGDTVLTADTVKGSKGSLTIGGSLTATVSGTATLSGTPSGSTVTTQGDLTLTAGTLQVDSTLSSGRDMTITATTATIGAGGVLSATGAQTVTATTLTNGGRISTQGSAAITAQTLTNTDTLNARQDLTLSGTTLTNSGLLLAGGTLAVRTPGTLTNSGGTVMGLQGVEITGSTATDRARQVENISGTVQAGSDGNTAGLTIRADRIVNRKQDYSVTNTTTAAPGEVATGVSCSGELGCTHSVSYTVQSVDRDSAPAKMLADGAVTLDATTVRNDQSQIYAGLNALIRAVDVENVAFDLTTTRTVTTAVHRQTKSCTWRGCKHNRWTEYPAPTVQLLADRTQHHYGTLQAAGTLDIQATGTVSSTGQQSGVTRIGLSGGSVSDAVTGVSFPASVTRNAPPAEIRIPAAEAKGLFVRTQSPQAKYKVETNPALTSMAVFYGSDYFLRRTGFDPNALAIRRLGDAGFETRLVRDQIFAVTGQRFLSADITSDAAQMQRLMDNALTLQSGLGLSLGVALTADQVAALQKDILWFEESVVDGERVLVPRLYLAQVTEANLSARNAMLMASTVTINAARVANNGLIGGNSVAVTSSGTVVNSGGALSSRGALTVTAGTDLVNQSGQITGQSVALTAGRDLVLETAVTRMETASGHSSILHQQAGVSAGQAVALSAGRDLASAGAAVTAGTTLTASAGRDLVLGAATASRSFSSDAGGRIRESSTRSLGNTWTAGSNASLTALGDIAVAGSTVRAGQDLTVTAGGSVVETVVQDTDHREIQRQSRGGLLGGKRSEELRTDSSRSLASSLQAGGSATVTALGGDVAVVGSAIRAGSGDAVVSAAGDVVLSTATDSDSRTETSDRSGRLTGRSREHTLATTTAVGSTVTAGRDIRLTSSGGDVTLQMARAEAGRDLTLSAATGTVSLLTGKDTRFEQTKSSSNNGVWQKSRDQGSTGETLHATRLSAGDDLTITAGQGVVVEVDTRGDLRASLEAMASQPGMAWVAQLRGREDVNWRLVQAHYDSWDHKSQGLTGPAAALIALAVTIATSGTGAGAAGLIGIGAENAALAAGIDAAASAAISSLASTATVSLINNRGNIGAVLKEMGSSANVRSLLVAMGSAGVAQGLAGSLNINTSPEAAFSDRLAFTGLKAGTGVVLNSTIGGQRLEDALKSGALSAATTLASQTLFKGIGDLAADTGLAEGDLRKVLLHAMAGCAVGQITQQCMAGAIGAGLQELGGDAINRLSSSPERRVQLSGLVAAAATLLVGGDAAAVNAANSVAQDARTYNRQLHTAELLAIRDKAKALADTNGDGILSPEEKATANTWETRLTSEALRTVDAYWNTHLDDDVEAAQILKDMAAGNSDFDVAVGGRAVAFLRKDAFYNNRALYANFIRENADLYDKALARWTPQARSALQGMVTPSSLAVLDSIGSSRWQDLSPEDMGKGDAENIATTGKTVVDALADIRAAERELWAAYSQAEADLNDTSLSSEQRKAKEAVRAQLRSSITVAAQASNVAKIGFDQLLINGTAAGSTAFITETVSQLADLAWDVASAPVSPESRQQLFDRADAIATLFGNPGLIVDHYRDTYTQADALERQGRIRDAETLRAQATLDLLSMVAGGAGLAKTAVATLPRVAELAKLAAAGGKSTAGAGIASVTADAKAVLPAGYSELKSAGSAANTTGGLPDGHRRVVAPDGDIVILAPDGKVYASIDEIPSGGAGSSAGGGVNGMGTLTFGTNGRKLDFLFNRNIDQSNAYNAARAEGNSSRIGIADTPYNRIEVIRLFNKAFNDPRSIVGSGKLPGSNIREFFMPGITGTGSKIQFVEQNGNVITIMAK